MINKGLLYNKDLIHKKKETEDLCYELEIIYKSCLENHKSCKGLEETLKYWKCSFLGSSVPAEKK